MQPIQLATMTIRTDQTDMSVQHELELHVDGVTVTITPDRLTIMTAERLHSVAWDDLVDMLDGLAGEYEPDDVVSPTAVDPLAWLLGRPGVVFAGNANANGNGRHGALARAA